jgi:hypothetical protein
MVHRISLPEAMGKVFTNENNERYVGYVSGFFKLGICPPSL